MSKLLEALNIVVAENPGCTSSEISARMCKLGFRSSTRAYIAQMLSRQNDIFVSDSSPDKAPTWYLRNQTIAAKAVITPSIPLSNPNNSTDDSNLLESIIKVVKEQPGCTVAAIAKVLYKPQVQDIKSIDNIKKIIRLLDSQSSIFYSVDSVNQSKGWYLRDQISSGSNPD